MRPDCAFVRRSSQIFLENSRERSRGKRFSYAISQQAQHLPHRLALSDQLSCASEQRSILGVRSSIKMQRGLWATSLKDALRQPAAYSRSGAQRCLPLARTRRDPRRERARTVARMSSLRCAPCPDITGFQTLRSRVVKRDHVRGQTPCVARRGSSASILPSLFSQPACRGRRSRESFPAID